MVGTDAVNDFWNWFKIFFNITKRNWEKELSVRLKLVHPQLTFLVGRSKTESPNELVITSNGIKEVFPLVIDVVNAAPKMEKWKVIAFKQKKSIKGAIKYNGLKIYPNELYFDYRINQGLFNITLFIKNLDHYDKRFAGAGFVILDNLLGEYNVATKIGAIEFKKLPENHNNLLQIIELDSVVNNS